MALLVVQKPVATGVAATMAAAAAGGDTFPNSGKEWVRVTNGHATLARTVTIDAPATCSFGLGANAAHDKVVSVAALTTKIIGPFPPHIYNDATARVVVTYSDSGADLTIGIFATE